MCWHLLSYLLPLIQNQRGGLLSSYMATVTILQVIGIFTKTTWWWEHSWGEEALSYSYQCSLYFSVFSSHHQQLYCLNLQAAQEISAVAKMQKIQVEQKGFLRSAPRMASS